jgi:hypothetical protein
MSGGWCAHRGVAVGALYFDAGVADGSANPFLAAMQTAHDDSGAVPGNPLLRKLHTARRLGLAAAARLAIGRVGDLVLSRSVLVVAAMTPEQLRPTAARSDGVDIVLRSADAGELLAEESGAATIPRSFREGLAGCRAGERVHVATADGRLAAWGFSVRPTAPWPLTETGTQLHVAPGGTCFINFETLPEFRGRRLQAALIAHMAAERFRENASVAYIWWEADNIASGKNSVRAGFVPFEMHHRTRVLRMGRPHVSPIRA